MNGDSMVDHEVVMWWRFCRRFNDGWWNRFDNPDNSISGDYREFKEACAAGDKEALAKLTRFTAWKMKG